MTNEGNKTVEVVLTQQTAGWQDTSITKIGDVVIADNNILKVVDKDQTITVSYDTTNNEVTFTVKN